MNASPVNRQPQGIPAGVQFAASTHAESAVDLQSPAGLPLILDPGESEDYSEYADGDVITRLSVLRSDDGGTFHVEASKYLNLNDVVPAGDLRINDAGPDAWLDANSAVENFFRRRYNAETATDDWEDVRVDCSISIQADSVTAAPGRRRGVEAHEHRPAAQRIRPRHLRLGFLLPNAMGARLQAARTPMPSWSTHGLWQRRSRLVPASAQQSKLFEHLLFENSITTCP